MTSGCPSLYRINRGGVKLSDVTPTKLKSKLLSHPKCTNKLKILLDASPPAKRLWAWFQVYWNQAHPNPSYSLSSGTRRCRKWMNHIWRTAVFVLAPSDSLFCSSSLWQRAAAFKLSLRPSNWKAFSQLNLCSCFNTSSKGRKIISWQQPGTLLLLLCSFFLLSCIKTNRPSGCLSWLSALQQPVTSPRRRHGYLLKPWPDGPVRSSRHPMNAGFFKFLFNFLGFFFFNCLYYGKSASKGYAWKTRVFKRCLQFEPYLKLLQDLLWRNYSK